MGNILISISVFVVVMVVHELAHGYVAYRMGDNTARDSGRLTVNPLAHIDPIGTVLLPVILIFSHSPVVFGWAKPVPVDPRRFSNPRKGMFITALAGPVANFILAGLFAALFKTQLLSNDTLAGQFLVYGVIISVILGIFNMIPVPPLDGANVLLAIMPPAMARNYAKLWRYGFLIVIGLLYLGVFDRVILPLARFFTRILLG